MVVTDFLGTEGFGVVTPVVEDFAEEKLPNPSETVSCEAAGTRAVLDDVQRQSPCTPQGPRRVESVRLQSPSRFSCWQDWM